MKSARIGALALAAIAALGSTAQAAVSSTASLTNLTIYVFDLTPLDNVAASYSIVAGPDSYTYANIFNGANDSDCCAGSFGSSVSNGLASSSATFTDGSAPLAAVARFGASAQVMNAAQAAAAGATLVTSMSYDNFVMAAQSQSSGGNTWASSYTSFQVQFGPGTLLVVAGDVSVSSMATASASGEWTYATGQVGFSSSNDGTFVGSYGYLQTSSGSEYANLSPSAAQTIVGSVGNFGINNMSLYLNAQAYTGAQVAAIPEPETYALMMLGLGLIGWTAKRRQR